MKTAIPTVWVIRNSKTVDDDGPLYWNNDTGWGCFASAERFSDDEKNAPGFSVPVDGVFQHAYDGMDMLNGDDEWFGRLQERGFTIDKPFAPGEAQRGLEELKLRLIAHAGCAVVLPVIDEDLFRYADRGNFYNGGTARHEPMRTSRCHENSAELWSLNPERNILCTGYAMSKDGVWRQHSWIWDAVDECVVETTELRVVYFGVEFDYNEAERFYSDNT